MRRFSLGTLIALTPDYQRLTATLERDHVDAWAPIEEVIQLILDRESGKFRDALAPHLTDEDLLPADSYGPAEQIAHLLAHSDGERQLRGNIPESLRGADAEAYVNAINLMIPEHPFLRDREFANPVFAGFALAAGIFSEAIDLTSTRDHLRNAARTPFLWRSFSNLARNNGKTIAGSGLGYLLTSRWNDPGEAAGPIHISSRGQYAEVAFPDNERVLRASLPIRFFERIQDLVAEVAVPNTLGVELAGEAFTISGPVVLVASSLRMATEKLFLEGSVWIETDLLEPRETLTLTVGTDALVGWNDTIDAHYPWSRTDTQLTHNPLVDPEPVNQLEAMIADVVGHAPSHSVVVDAGSLSVAQDEPRWTWTKRQYDELFRRFLRLLVEEEKAVLRHIDTSANRPRARVIFRFSWLDLAKVVRGEMHDADLESVVEKARDEFPQRLLYL